MGNNIFKFRRDNFVEQEVNGTMCRFYVLSPAALRRLKDTFRPLAVAFGALFASNNNDIGRTNRTAKIDGEEMETFESAAAEVEVLKLRSDERSSAISAIVDTLSGEASQREVMRLIVSSLRDDFSDEERRNPTPQFLDDMLEDMSLDTLVECLIGITKANKKLVDPFLKKLPAATQEQVSKVAAELRENLGAQTEPLEATETTSS